MLNVIPFIDILFLLLVFFAMVSQFIETEAPAVIVPDSCRFAQSDPEPAAQVTTVTVMKSADKGIDFAVGPEKIVLSDGHNIVGRLKQLIDNSLKDLPYDSRTVMLRMDKDICFSDAQYALAAVAASSAVNIRLAVLRDKSL